MMIYTAVITLMALILATMGVLALVNDRVPVARLGRSVNRPRVWGTGALLLAAAVGAARLLPIDVDVTTLMLGLALIGTSQVLTAPKGRRTA
ncbi:hypothetical protein AB0C52_05980 [Streptomyces sp. NPDC048717]|uniref:hypothetical protein n=1 Tax=unclassified Streptomyces TaxID=2593676 RepID=UPI00343BF18C